MCIRDRLCAVLGSNSGCFGFEIRVQGPKRIWRFALMLEAIGLLAAWIAITSFTMLWYDRHASRMGSKIPPWSCIVNHGWHFNRVAMDNCEQVLLPDAYFITAHIARKDVMVLVIGGVGGL